MWTKPSRFDFAASRRFTVPGEELYSPPLQKLLGAITSREPSRKSYTPSQKSSDWREAPEAAAIAWFAISTANEIRRKVLVTLALYRRRAFGKKVRVSTVFWRAFDKAVRRKPPAVAADAGPMQIQWWEGSVPRCAGTVRESTAAGTEREESAVGAKFSRRDGSRKWKDAAGRTARHRETERADARKDSVWWRVVSCGSRKQARGRTKLDLGSSKPFDDPHRPTTLGTKSKIVRGGCQRLLGLRCRAEQMKAKRQERSASAVGEEAEVANAHEAFRKHVQQEAAQEFIER